jgi:hypothetical protein
MLKRRWPRRRRCGVRCVGRGRCGRVGEEGSLRKVVVGSKRSIFRRAWRWLVYCNFKKLGEHEEGSHTSECRQ